MTAQSVTDSNGHVTLKRLSEQLNMDGSLLRKYVLKLGYKPLRVRTAESRGQLLLALSAVDAAEVIAKRNEQGYLDARPLPSNTGDHGFFYAILLVPEFSEMRFKFGFAVDANDRLAQHRTAAPTARIVKAWPCKRVWEIAAIDCAAHGAKRVGQEVYDVEDAASVIERLDRLFTLLCGPTAEVL